MAKGDAVFALNWSHACHRYNNTLEAISVHIFDSRDARISWVLFASIRPIPSIYYNIWCVPGLVSDNTQHTRCCWWWGSVIRYRIRWYTICSKSSTWHDYLTFMWWETDVTDEEYGNIQIQRRIRSHFYFSSHDSKWSRSYHNSHTGNRDVRVRLCCV